MLVSYMTFFKKVLFSELATCIMSIFYVLFTVSFLVSWFLSEAYYICARYVLVYRHVIIRFIVDCIIPSPGCIHLMFEH